jgi:hypothetical protein
MTTTNDGGIHPMVMKAARVLARLDGCANWADFSQVYIDQAQAALTECGALECLEALEKHQKASTYAEENDANAAGYTAIAKVYGSAPE